MGLSLQILDDKASAFIDLLNSLDFVVSIEKEGGDVTGLTDVQKKILDERLLDYEQNKDAEKKSWSEFRSEIEQKYDL